jgi:hypothetical protein
VIFDRRFSTLAWMRQSIRIVFVSTITLSACSEQPSAVTYVAPSMEALAKAVSPAVELQTIAGQTRVKRDENAQRRDKTIEMTQQQASRLAGLFIARFGSFQRRTIELDAGVPINVQRLAPCRTARYAMSPFEPTDLRRLPTHVRNRYAAKWIVPICDGSALRAVVGFSAHADPEAISLDKNARMPNLNAASFFVAGINETRAPFLLDEPEAAVIYAANASNAKVAASPQLVIMPRSGPARPFWRVVLERKVGLLNDDDSTPSQDSVLYVGGSDSDKQFVPTGFALYAGFAEANRKPKKARLNLGPVPLGLRQDRGFALDVAKISRLNNKAIGENF